MAPARDPTPRRRLAALIAVAVVAAAAGLVTGARDGKDRSAQERAQVPAAEEPGSPVGDLPLEVQVGQLLLMSFEGTRPPEYVLRRLRRGEGAGVILFGRNATAPQQLRGLTASLQDAAGGGALVATDQEGGEIRSIAFAGPEASQASLTGVGAAAGPAREAASALDEAGVNVNLAPVADVASVPESVMGGRAYPGSADAVAEAVEAAVRAHEREGVAATVKHFPGLGAATANTDDVPVTVEAPRAELDPALEPFRAAVEAGVPVVMASHALYPALDTERIASQSRAVLKGLLRLDLGFDGAVVTDSIEAEAVLARGGVADAAVRSVGAGADLVLMTGSGSWNLVYPALLERARRDPRFRDRVTGAAGRVLALKRRLGLSPPAATR